VCDRPPDLSKARRAKQGRPLDNCVRNQEAPFWRSKQKAAAELARHSYCAGAGARITPDLIPEALILQHFLSGKSGTCISVNNDLKLMITHHLSKVTCPSSSRFRPSFVRTLIIHTYVSFAQGSLLLKVPSQAALMSFDSKIICPQRLNTRRW
jgi:hypothetical protein